MRPSPARLLSRMFRLLPLAGAALPQKPAPNRLSRRDLGPVALFGSDWKPGCTV